MLLSSLKPLCRFSMPEDKVLTLYYVFTIVYQSPQAFGAEALLYVSVLPPTAPSSPGLQALHLQSAYPGMSPSHCLSQSLCVSPECSPLEVPFWTPMAYFVGLSVWTLFICADGNAYLKW